MQAKFENLADSEMQVTVNLTKEEFEKFRKLGLERVQSTVQIDGFRKGNAPEDLIIKKYGDMVVLEEMANLAISETLYTTIINENQDRKGDDKILPLTQPKVSITKIGIGEGLEYKATFPITPEVKLDDYKKLAKDAVTEVEEVMLKDLRKNQDSANLEDLAKVSEAEVDQVIKDLRKTRAIGQKNLEKNKAKNGAKEEDIERGSEAKAEKISDLQAEFENLPDSDLPTLDDAFAQSFGEKFKTVDDLKKQIKENLELEKAAKFQNQRRTKILEKLVESTKIQIPEALLKEELDRMKAQTKAEVEQYGNTWTDYLKTIKKSEEEIVNEWREVAKKRVTSQLIVSQIAKLEGIEAEPMDIEAEAIKVLTQIPNANRNNVESYVKQILVNEAVMKFLNEEKDKVSPK